MSATELSPGEARAVLGVDAAAAPDEIAAAFRAAAKRLHPDRPGGDAEAFRRALGAYRLLQAMPRLPVPLRASAVLTPFVEIDPLTALRGGEAEAVLADGRRIRVRTPPGARHGELAGVGGAQVHIRVRNGPAIQLRGSDLWVTARVAGSRLEEGGRACVDTLLGPKVLWISRKVAERRLVRLEGQGLPARASHRQGSLFIRLAPDAAAPESQARAQLRRFAAAWAA